MSYSYICSPYSHEDEAVRHARYLAVDRYVHHLICYTNIIPYSPIMHFHHHAQQNDLPKDAKFWARHNRTMLAGAKNFYVLNIPGAAQSKGIFEEIGWGADAKKQGILATPISDLSPAEGYIHDETDIQQLVEELR